MKPYILVVTSLLAFAWARPAEDETGGHGHQKHGHNKRTRVVVTNTVMTTLPAATVVAGSASDPRVAHSSSSTSSFSDPRVAHSSSSTSSFSDPRTAHSSSTTSSSSTSSTSAAASSTLGLTGNGIGYDAYNADTSCKTTAEVASDLGALSGYSVVRIYGTDCNQVANVLAAASAKGMKVILGVYDITETSSSIDIIIAAVGGNWTNVHTVSIGNEGVNDGTYTVAEVVAAIGTARSMLRSAGYEGPVVTVDTYIATIDNPALCEASDYAAVNCHAFFNSDLTASQAGAWVLQQAEAVSTACGGMKTVITESGWPSNGTANGDAVPSEANQQAAIASLQESFPNDIVLFSAYNDAWKQDNAYTFGAEKYWGIHGNCPTCS